MAARRKLPRLRPGERLEFKEADCLALAAMAARGLTQAQAAAKMGIAERTLRYAFERDEAAAAAWEVGRTELYEEIFGTLVSVARNPKHPKQVLAALAIMNSLYGWRDNADRQVTANVRIELPAALPRDEYEKRVVDLRAVPKDLPEVAT